MVELKSQDRNQVPNQESSSISLNTLCWEVIAQSLPHVCEMKQQALRLGCIYYNEYLIRQLRHLLKNMQQNLSSYPE